MQFGVCAKPADAPALAAAGFDYVEVHVQNQLRASDPEDVFLAEMKVLRSGPIPCLAANCFLPGDMRITGFRIDLNRLARYVDTVMERANRAGIRVIVFGSGAARRIPDDFERDRAWKQLVDFGTMAANSAAKYGITIAAEPLNKSECNVLNSVGETARFVREIRHPSMRLLVDAYHWARDNDSYEDLVAAGPILRHAHIATYDNRKAPTLEPADFSRFFAALKEGGYEGRMSIEASWNDMAQEAPAALAELRRLAKEAGL